MKWVLVVLASLHGLIHLMGFVNELGIKKIEAFTGSTTIAVSEPIRRGLGIAWLLTCCVMVAAASGLALSQSWWKSVLLSGVALSQLLVFVWWRDAWAGTIANVLLVVAAMAH